MELPEGHRLAEMYAQYPTYDFLPWKIIRAVLGSNGLTDSTLVDIGANIGDTAAHFRNFSEGKVICVEPQPKFFYALTRNSVNFGNVELINKLVCPSDLVGKVAFSSGPQTGGTAVADNSTDVWAGEYITLEALCRGIGKDFIFKTDTDGFDAEIVKELNRLLMFELVASPSVIFYETASAPQLLSGEYMIFVEAIAALQQRGYEVLILTNFGTPYVFAGRSPIVVRSAFDGLSIGYRINRATCHYFDILAVRQDLDTAAIRSVMPFLS